MLAYFAWCCASVLWSVEPGMGLKRIVTLGCFCACALGLDRRFSMRELAWMTLAILASYFVIGLVVEVTLGTFRPWQSGHRFAGRRCTLARCIQL